MTLQSLGLLGLLVVQRSLGTVRSRYQQRRSPQLHVLSTKRTTRAAAAGPGKR
jgi:hypothetical protein